MELSKPTSSQDFMPKEEEWYIEEFRYLERNHGWIPEHKQMMEEFLHEVAQKSKKEQREEIRQKLKKGGISSDCIYQDEIDKLLE